MLFTKLCLECLWTWVVRETMHLGVNNMAWLAMAIQIISPCEVFLVIKGGKREREIQD
jgi:hypothetical protein